MCKKSVCWHVTNNSNPFWSSKQGCDHWWLHFRRTSSSPKAGNKCFSNLMGLEHCLFKSTLLYLWIELDLFAVMLSSVRPFSDIKPWLTCITLLSTLIGSEYWGKCQTPILSQVTLTTSQIKTQQTWFLKLKTALLSLLLEYRTLKLFLGSFNFKKVNFKTRSHSWNDEINLCKNLRMLEMGEMHGTCCAVVPIYSMCVCWTSGGFPWWIGRLPMGACWAVEIACMAQVGHFFVRPISSSCFSKPAAITVACGLSGCPLCTS